MDSAIKARKGPLTLSDTNNSEVDPILVSMEKQNALAAEILQHDLDTFFYACIYCPRILMSLQKLRAHEQAFHPGSRPSTCHEVPFDPEVKLEKSSFEESPPPSLSPALLGENTQVQMPKLVPQNLGQMAGTKPRQILRVPGTKRRNFKKVHLPAQVNGGSSGSGEFGCKHCHSSFTSPWNLKVHLQTIHENVRPFKCSTCGKSFKQRIHLHGHSISTHSNFKPFKCELCTVAFSKKWNLFDHVRKHHQGTKADLERLKFKYSKRKKSGEMD